LVILIVSLINISCGQIDKEEAKIDASNAPEEVMLDEFDNNDEIIIKSNKVFVDFNEDEIKSFYKKKHIDLQYCEFSPSKNYALVCFEHQYGFLAIECVDTNNNRTMLKNAYWMPEQIEFLDDAHFTLLGCFGVNGIEPPESTFPTIAGFQFDYSNNMIVPYDIPRYQAPLNKSYSIGEVVHAVISRIRLTANGFDFEFLPQVGYEDEFYAAYSHVPICLFKYDEDSGAGTVQMESTVIGSDCDYFAANDSDSAVLWYKAREEGNSVIIEFKLNELAKFYYWDRCMKLNLDPIALLRFSHWDD
jgi:hypothetical protein